MIYVIPKRAQVYELVPSGKGVCSVMMHDLYTSTEKDEIGRCLHVLSTAFAKGWMDGPDDGYWYEEK